MEDQCLFCEKVRVGDFPEKIWEDEHFLAFLDHRPVEEGHTLLIPKRHVDYLFNLEDPLYDRFFRTAKWLSPVVKEFAGASRVGLAVEGFGVPHTHIHLVPINHGGELVRPRGEVASSEALQKVAECMRALIP